MTVGPLQMIAISFDTRDVSEEIALEINALRANGVLRLIDFVFVERDNQGETSRFISIISGSADEIKAREQFAGAGNNNDIYVSKNNIETISECIPNGGSAIIALIEHLWAARLWNSIEKSQGVVLAEEFIPNTAVYTWGTQLVEAIKSVQRASP
jgi:uncharacterized membrane protein